MFNINRPLVIYESMTLSFDHLDFQQASVEMLEPKMEVNGKRATAFYTSDQGGRKMWSAQALRN